eukprot:TRINITY_DN36843_c0_g1_i1.p1 TRINITY_DN36843_c0_g1~~TRINITY_DN36843_c0_g1_i1.p1  ORF type:complete len:547 (-),score=93.59 TRINITY_DN36843_c0_g1_i1:81-1517(-)
MVEQPAALPSSRIALGGATQSTPWRSPEVSARSGVPRIPESASAGAQGGSCQQYAPRNAPAAAPVQQLVRQPALRAATNGGGSPSASRGGSAQVGGSHTMGVAAAASATPPSWTSRHPRPVASGQGAVPDTQPESRAQLAGTRRSGDVMFSQAPTPSEGGARPAAAARARSVEPPGNQQTPQVSLPSSRSMVPAPGRMAASSFVPAAPRFYSYTPAVGTSRPSSYTPSVSRGVPQIGGRTAGSEVPVPVRFFEGLSRPATSPLLMPKSGGTARMPDERDRLMASMQPQHMQSMLLEGIASAPGRHSMPRITRPAAKASASTTLVQPPAGTSMASSSSSSGTASALSPQTLSRSVQAAPSTPGVARRREDGEAEPSMPPVNQSPPLMRYVVKGDGSVEKQQENLQAATVPALAAAAMAAVREAEGRCGVLRRRSPLNEASGSGQPGDALDVVEGQMAAAPEVTALQDSLVQGLQGRGLT